MTAQLQLIIIVNVIIFFVPHAKLRGIPRNMIKFCITISTYVFAYMCCCAGVVQEIVILYIGEMIVRDLSR